MRTLLWKTGRRWWLQANLVELTFRVSHFLHGCWSDHDRHGNVEAQDFCCHVDMGHIDQYTRSEPEIICQGRTKMKSKTAMTLQDRTTTMWILISYFDQGISAHACIYHHDVVYLLSEFLTKLSSTLTIRTTYDNKTRLISSSTQCHEILRSNVICPCLLPSTYTNQKANQSTPSLSGQNLYS